MKSSGERAGVLRKFSPLEPDISGFFLVCSILRSEHMKREIVDDRYGFYEKQVPEQKLRLPFLTHVLHLILSHCAAPPVTVTFDT